MLPIFQSSAECLGICVPELKCQAVDGLWRAVQEQGFDLDPHTPLTTIGVPGRPEKPELVKPAKLPRRRLGSEHGRAALVHAIAHIEFNAIKGCDLPGDDSQVAQV